MAKKNRIGLEFEGLEQMMSKLEQFGGDIQGTVETALVESKRHVHKNLESAMAKHNETFETVKSLKNSEKVEWAGSVAKIGVGFDIANGGLPSIFLMYGTPKMSPDKNLYNAVYGNKTKKEVAQIQEQIFLEELRRVMT